MSSIYMTTHPSIISSRKMSFIIVWNVAGELVNPKNITSGSNRPRLVRKAAFHSSPSLILMLLYPHRTSIFEKYLASDSLSTSSEMSGKGYLCNGYTVTGSRHSRYTESNMYSSCTRVERRLFVHVSDVLYRLHVTSVINTIYSSY